MKIMVTGHRPEHFTLKTQTFAQYELRKLMKHFVKNEKIDEAISGFALGVDTWWSELAVEFDVPLAAYIPFEAQSSTWSNDAKSHWENLRKKALRERIAGDHYDVRFFHARNQWMVNDCDLAIAVWSPSVRKGGTYSTVRKLEKARRPYIVIDVDECRVVKKFKFD